VKRPTLRAIGWIVRSICSASSRVGARISAFGLRPNARRLPAWLRSTASTSGAPNAMVLPEPVRPRASTSLPARIGAIVAAWIGNGAAAPSSARVRTMLSPRPRLEKLTSATSSACTACACSFSCTTSACSS
jgi:hypothetical protein